MTVEACMIVGHPSFLGNRFFSEDPAVIRDNCSDMYVRLRRKLFERGIELNTEDITPHRTARLLFQLDCWTEARGLPGVDAPLIAYMRRCMRLRTNA